MSLCGCCLLSWLHVSFPHCLSHLVLCVTCCITRLLSRRVMTLDCLQCLTLLLFYARSLSFAELAWSDHPCGITASQESFGRPHGGQSGFVNQSPVATKTVRSSSICGPCSGGVPASRKLISIRLSVTKVHVHSSRGWISAG